MCVLRVEQASGTLSLDELARARGLLLRADVLGDGAQVCRIGEMSSKHP